MGNTLTKTEEGYVYEVVKHGWVSWVGSTETGINVDDLVELAKETANERCTVRFIQRDGTAGVGTTTVPVTEDDRGIYYLDLDELLSIAYGDGRRVWDGTNTRGVQVDKAIMLWSKDKLNFKPLEEDLERYAKKLAVARLKEAQREQQEQLLRQLEMEAMAELTAY